MPPEQCPACGRFLSSSFVRSATDAPRPCPGCENDVHLGLAATPLATAPVSDAHPLDGWDRDPVPQPAAERAIDVRPDTLATLGVAGVIGAAVAGRRHRLVGALLAAIVALVLMQLRD